MDSKEVIAESGGAKSHDELSLLRHAINRVCADKKFTALKNVSDLTENSIDLSTIENKAELYADFDELVADVKMIADNPQVLECRKLSKMAKELLDCVEVEIKKIKICHECYSHSIEHPITWFEMVCTKPHLIVWAKVSKTTFWPAKLMSNNGKTVNIRFFHDHLFSDMQENKCFFYSKLNPMKPPRSSKPYDAAVLEANKYIDNIVERFGSFKYAAEKTVFQTELMDQYSISGGDPLASDEVSHAPHFDGTFTVHGCTEAAPIENQQLETTSVLSSDAGSNVSPAKAKHIDKKSPKIENVVELNQRKRKTEDDESVESVKKAKGEESQAIEENQLLMKKISELNAKIIVGDQEKEQLIRKIGDLNSEKMRLMLLFAAKEKEAAELLNAHKREVCDAKAKIFCVRCDKNITICICCADCNKRFCEQGTSSAM